MALSLCIAVMVAALLLGGGTRSGLLSDVLLQLVAVPLLGFTVWRYGAVPKKRRSPWMLIAIAGVIAFPVVQLLPLPEVVWGALPLRSVLSQGFGLAGVQRGVLSLSVTSRDTWLAAMSLIPPVAMFVGVLLLTYRQRRTLSLVVVGVGLASAVVGLLQVAQGQESPLRFYEVTNAADTVGFFANRNHFAALNYSVLTLLGVWLISVTTAIGTKNKSLNRSRDSAWVFYLIVGLSAFALQISTQAMTRSRAGIGLMVVAIGFVMAIGIHERAAGSRSKSVGLLGGALALGLVLTFQYALFGIADRLIADPLQDYRIRFGRNTTEAALAYMPWGSGVGSFTSIYPMFEKVGDLTLGVFANRAHNDILELWLEMGIPGLVTMVIFLIWLVLRGFRLWSEPQVAGSPIDPLLAKGAIAILVLLLAHSFVDYPLRTGAIMVLAAFCCAILVTPLVQEENGGKYSDEELKQLNNRCSAQTATANGSHVHQSAPKGRLASVAWPSSPEKGMSGHEGSQEQEPPISWPAASPFYVAEPIIAKPGEDPPEPNWPKEWKRPVN